MSFLKKFGEFILRATEIVVGFAPVAAATFPGEAGAIQVVSRDLSQIAGVITTVEAIGQTLGQPGPQKLQAAAPLVAQVILQSSILVDHSIADPGLFQKGAQKIADGMADVLNSLKENIQSTSKT